MRLYQLLGKSWKPEVKTLLNEIPKQRMSSKLSRPLKIILLKVYLPLTRQPTKHPASGHVCATADMKRQWYRVKIKLDETNEIKSKMADIPICS